MIDILISASLQTVLIGLSITTAHCALSIFALIKLIRSRMELHSALMWILLATFVPFIGPAVALYIAVTFDRRNPPRPAAAPEVAGESGAQPDIEAKRKQIEEAEAELLRLKEEFLQAEANDGKIH